MLDTSDVVAWLEGLDDTSGLCEVLPVTFDPSEFVHRVARSATLTARRSSDGLISTVRDDADTRDKSKQSKSFDLHTDGCYYETPPELVLLYCQDPGSTGIRTVVGDSTAAIGTVSEFLPIFDGLDFIYIGKDLAEHRRPLIERHPRTGQPITNLATRGYVHPRVSPETLAGVPDLKDIVAALQSFYAAIDANVVLDHTWKRGDLLVFDNLQYLHGRRGGTDPDPQRSLARVWVQPEPTAGDMEAAAEGSDRQTCP